MSLFVVIGGISSGLLCSAYFKDSPRTSKRFHRAANIFGNISGLCLITFSVAVSSSDHKARIWDEDLAFFIGVAVPAVVGIILATAMATTFDLEKPERVAVAVESCYQNTGIATSVAVFMFNSNEDDLASAISVPLYYGLCEAILLAAYCIFCWKLGWTKVGLLLCMQYLRTYDAVRECRSTFFDDTWLTTKLLYSDTETKAPPDENICVVIATSYEVEAQEHEEDVAAVGVALESDDGEEAIVGDIVKAGEDLDFEQSIDGVPVVEENAEGPVVVRKKNSHGSNTSVRSGSMTGHSQSGDHHDVLRHPPEETEGTASVAESSTGGDDIVLDEDQTEDHIEISRLGRAMSQLKARVTGYRQAPPPQEDGSVTTTPPRMPASMAESGETPESPKKEMDGPSSRRTNRSYGQLPDAPASPERVRSIANAPSAPEAATPAEGKTID
jgi:hypothetical protein